MGEWTWLHALFPLADIELTKPPIDAKVANVLVRTVRRMPQEGIEGKSSSQPRFQVRVAPHNVAPFRGGPWTRVFSEADLTNPGDEWEDFRIKLAAAIEQVYPSST